MWKKILVSIFICSSLLTIGSISYATGGTDNATIKKEIQINIEQKETKVDEKVESKKERIDVSKYQLINPEEKAYTSKKKVAFISGKAPSGTFIGIRLYGTTDLTRKNFNLSKLPKKEDYIEIHSEVIKSGNMGFFDKQLDLVTGINKIIVNFNAEDVPSQEIIVFVEPKTVGANKEVRLTDIMPFIR